MKEQSLPFLIPQNNFFGGGFTLILPEKQHQEEILVISVSQNFDEY